MRRMQMHHGTYVTEDSQYVVLVFKCNKPVSVQRNRRQTKDLWSMLKMVGSREKKKIKDRRKEVTFLRFLSGLLLSSHLLLHRIARRSDAGRLRWPQNKQTHFFLPDWTDFRPTVVRVKEISPCGRFPQRKSGWEWWCQEWEGGE